MIKLFEEYNDSFKKILRNAGFHEPGSSLALEFSDDAFMISHFQNPMIHMIEKEDDGDFSYTVIWEEADATIYGTQAMFSDFFNRIDLGQIESLFNEIVGDVEDKSFQQLMMAGQEALEKIFLDHTSKGIASQEPENEPYKDLGFFD